MKWTNRKRLLDGAYHDDCDADDANVAAADDDFDDNIWWSVGFEYIRKKYNMLARAIIKIGQDGGDDDDDGCGGNDCYLQPRWRWRRRWRRWRRWWPCWQKLRRRFFLRDLLTSQFWLHYDIIMKHHHVKMVIIERQGWGLVKNDGDDDGDGIGIFRVRRRTRTWQNWQRNWTPRGINWLRWPSSSSWFLCR